MTGYNSAAATIVTGSAGVPRAVQKAGHGRLQTEAPKQPMPAPGPDVAAPNGAKPAAPDGPPQGQQQGRRRGTHVPESHPRAESLHIRDTLVRGFEDGLVATEGLLAHGRGEAFDYLLGEETGQAARRACRAAAAAMLAAERPVISVNGNAAALCPEHLVELAAQTGAALEINLFYDSGERRAAIARHLRAHGAVSILGTDRNNMTTLEGTDSARRMVDVDGIHAADVVVVPLEDGDRTQALKRAGKTVITFDLNPLSRTAQAADISIIDNITRAVKVLASECRSLASEDAGVLRGIVSGYDNAENMRAAMRQIASNLEGRAQRGAARDPGHAGGGGGGLQ